MTEVRAISGRIPVAAGKTLWVAWILLGVAIDNLIKSIRFLRRR